MQPWFTVPFVRDITEKFNKLNSIWGYRFIVLINCENLLSLYMHKDPLLHDKKLNVIYKISCKCAMQIMGQTYRQLRSRITHKNHIRCHNGAPVTRRP